MARDRDLRILVATDGSTHAKAALTTAMRFPWPEASRVWGATARQVPADYRRSILLAALDRSADAVATKTRRVLTRRWPDAEVAVVDAAPVAGILGEARRVRADVIVLGWRGFGALRAFLMGSVSRGVIRGAKASILLVKGRGRDVRRVVVGFDGSTNARRAVALVASLRPPRGGRVTLFHAVEHRSAPSHGLAPGGVRATVAAEVARINAQRTAQARKDLARAAATLTRAGWRVKTAVSAAPPLRGLLGAVDAARADLLVVGTRGTSGVRQLLLGSVAEGALSRCAVPILVVR